ncbi:MAG TPA: hypothetical protein VGR02_02255 [Thermoanaerobaculia bacterium]|jgi:hypothetical protein|nr:hypothetical protein [Thermoanaerobaculia bacterium]
MHFLLFALGATVLVLTAIDLVSTTLGVSGAGPLTGRLTHWIWQGCLALHKVVRSHKMLSHIGPGLLAFGVVVWVTLVWSGWTLIFCSARDSILNAQTRRPATVEQRAYYVAAAMVTVGNTEWVPNGPLWRGATVLAAGSGLGTVTVAITYLLEVVSALVMKRTFGAYISSLGGTPSRIIARSWDGEKLVGLEPHLVELAQMMEMLTQQHLAYPILHYFHNKAAGGAATTRLAALHETLLLLGGGMAKELRPAAMCIEPLRDAMRQSAAIIAEEFIEPADQAPDPPKLDILRDRNIATVDDAQFRAAVANEEETRRALLGMLHNDGWKWADIYRNDKET